MARKADSIEPAFLHNALFGIVGMSVGPIVFLYEPCCHDCKDRGGNIWLYSALVKFFSGPHAFDSRCP